jgi:glycosyltransferase involved in cell wall biosynthesis
MPINNPSSKGRLALLQGQLKGEGLSYQSPKPIKILHIINDLTIGGAEMMLFKLLMRLDRERFDPVVISLRNRGTLNERIESLSIPVHSVAMRLPVPTPTSVYRLIRLVRLLEPDLIQGWLYHGNLAAQLASAFASMRPQVLWSVRQGIYSFDYEKRLTAWVIKCGAYLSRMPAKILYNSRTSAAQHAAIGYCQDKTLIIPNGFDTELFMPSKDARHKFRVELGVDPSALLIGLIGRYHPIKDHKNFLHAAAIIKRKYTNVHFILIGKGIGWNNKPLRELIQDLALVERTHLLGERRDIHRIIPAFDIAVSSSCMEGFPNVIGEAMSCEIPCVVTDISDLPWIVDRTGLIVPPKDSGALANALAKLIKLDHDGRKALGQLARQRVIDFFCMSAVTELYEEVYENVFLTNKSHLKSLNGYTRYEDLNLSLEKKAKTARSSPR